MRKVHLLSLAIAMASSTAYAVEQGEFVYHGFGTVGITHMGGEDDYDYGIQGQTNDGWRGDQLSKFAVQGQYGITDTLSLTGQLANWPANHNKTAGKSVQATSIWPGRPTTT